jgi:uncharacterized membrane protein YcfT
LRGNLIALAALATVLNIVEMPHYMYLDHLCRLYVFFIAGVIVAKNLGAAMNAFDRFALLFGAAFVAACVAHYFDMLPEDKMIIVGLLSLPALHAWARSRYLPAAGFLSWIGRYTLAIYLLNTISIGLMKGVLLYAFPWNAESVAWMALPLVAGGLFVPIIVKKALLARVPFLDRITS